MAVLSKVCPEEQVILDLALGTLPPEARQRTWAHVERCPECAGLIGAAQPFLGPGPDPSEAVAGAEADPTETPGASDGDPGAIEDAAARDAAHTVPGPSIGEPAPRSLQPGQDLRQRYRVVRYLGHGAMGEVYEARHARLVGRYALKILNVDLTHNPMARQRFRREAGIASELRHPNIVQVIDFDETEAGRPYLVMELLEGRDLGALIAQGPLPLARTLPLARQIAAGLAAMHGQGIVHRDLKPANVFVLPEGTGEPERIKLVDFGLSKRLVPSLAVTHDRMLLGTPQYMAPEQARGNSDAVGPAADQFAMAAIIYEMLAGRPAFDGELLSVVLFRIVYESPTPLGELVPGLPPGIEAAITRGLAKEPGERFPSVSEFWEALAAGERDEPRAAGVRLNTTRDDRAHPIERRRRTRWLALTASLLGTGVGLTWILIHVGSQETARPAPEYSATAAEPLASRPILPQEHEPPRTERLNVALDPPAPSAAPPTRGRQARRTAKKSASSGANLANESPASVAKDAETLSLTPVELPPNSPTEPPAADTRPAGEAQGSDATKGKNLVPLVPHL